MGTTDVTGRANPSRLDKLLGEYCGQLLPYKYRAEVAYYEMRAKRAERRGDFDTAREYYDEAVSLRGRLGDREASIELGNKLAEVAEKNGDLGVARKQYERIVELHARRENAPEALDAIEHVLDIAERQGDDDALGQWWGHALMVLGKAEPGDVSEERRNELLNQYAEQIYTEDSAGRIYGFALQQFLADEDEAGADLLEATWERRDVVREQVAPFRVVLAAGIGLVAYAELADRDVDRDEVLEFVADYREKLSPAATALFEHLSEGETDTDPEELRPGVGPDEEAELGDVEAEVFGQFLEDL